MNCTQALEKFHTKILPVCDYISVIRDINIDYKPSDYSNPFFSMFETYGFAQGIEEPTRITQKLLIFDRPCFCK